MDYTDDLREKNRALQTLVQNLLVICNQADFRNGNNYNGLDEGEVRALEIIAEFQQQAITLGVDYNPGSGLTEMVMPQRNFIIELEQLLNTFNFDTKIGVPDYVISSMVVDYLTTMIQLRIEQSKHNNDNLNGLNGRLDEAIIRDVELALGTGIVSITPNDNDRTKAFTLDELFGDNVDPQ